MSALEDRYRDSLRFYPASWRIRNEEAMIGTLLDTAEGEHRTEPRPLELANLAVHGIIGRMQAVPFLVPPGIRDRASTAALAIGTAIALGAAVQLEASPSLVGFEPFVGEYSTFGPFASPAILLYAAWGLAFFSSMAGFTTTARWAALATIPLAFAGRAAADANGMWLRPTWSFLALLIMLAILVAAGRPTPNRSSVRWLLAWFLPATIVFVLHPTLADPRAYAFQEPLWLNRPDLISWSPIIAMSLAVLLQLSGKPAWAATALLLSIPFTAAAVLGGRGVSLDVVWFALLLALLAAGAFLGAVIVLRMFGIRMQPTRTFSER
jgi:hypothetical protein